MSYQPLISKIRCHNPNKNSTRYANRANLHYIATREGVDLSQLNEDALEDNYFKYASEDVYTRYMSERPRSHGLFGNIDTTDLKKVEQTVYQISKTGQNVYRGIVSLGEMDAQALGYLDSSTWYVQMQSVMPDIASTLGISSTNFTWIGAYHAEPGHPHVHYQIWDNTERIHSSYIHTSVQKQCRKLLESSFFNEEYEKSLQAVFEAEREELYKNKNESRENITDYFKDIMKLQYVPGMLSAKLPQRFTTKEAEKLTLMLEKLQSILPDTGRMYYKFMPPSVKSEIDKISDFIFKRPEIKAALSRYLTAADQIHQIDHPGQSDVIRKLAKNDVYRRTGNIILKYAFPTGSSEKLFSIDETATQGPISRPSDGTLLSLAKVYLSDSAQNPDAAFEILSELTQTGDAEAQWLLGQIRLSGSYKGKPIEQCQDIPKAIELLQAASEQDNQFAQYTLGKFLLSEQYPGYQNIPKAIELLQDASEQDNQFAQYTLGKFLLSEQYPQYQDIPKAIKFLQDASEQDNQFARYTLGKFLLSEQYPQYQDIPKAIKLLQDASEQDNQFARYTLGKFLLSEQYPQYQDISKAIKLLQDASEQDNQFARYTLGKFLLSEQYPQYQDIPKAIKLLQDASEQGNQFAQYTLGKIYLYGQYSVPKDVQLGKRLLQASAEQGNKYAQNTLSHYEWMHSPAYLLSNLLYHSLYYSMMQSMHQKQQELTDRKTAISKQAQKEQNKEEEISHL